MKDLKRIQIAIKETVDRTTLEDSTLFNISDVLKGIETAGILTKDAITSIYYNCNTNIDRNLQDRFTSFIYELRFNLKLVGISNKKLMELHDIYINLNNTEFNKDEIKNIYTDLLVDKYDDFLITILILRQQIVYFDSCALARHTRNEYYKQGVNNETKDVEVGSSTI